MAPLPQKFERDLGTGFTLLEMLIVLALLGLLTVVLTGTVSLGISARGRVTAVASDQDDLSSFYRVLSLTLGRAYPDWITVGQYKSIDFDGAPGQLAFLAPSLEVQGQGLAKYQITLDQENGLNEILLRTSLSGAGSQPTLKTHFASGLTSVTFKYFGFTRDGNAAVWQDNWTMRTRPPDLVAIQVTFPKGDRRSWPLLVIHPGIDADVTCEIDAGSHRCTGR